MVNLEIEKQADEEESGFFGNIVQTVSGFFSSSRITVEDVINELGEDGEVIKIDTTNPHLTTLMQEYNVEIIPYIVVLENGMVLYSGQEKPNISVKKETIEESVKASESDSNDSENALYSSIEETNASSKSSTAASESVIGGTAAKSDKISSEVKVVSSIKASAPQEKIVMPKPVPVKRIDYVATPFGFRADNTTFENVDDNWKKILEEEEKIVEEIKEIYEDDRKLADSLKNSEDEIHESEELFYQAKNAIDKTLEESEQQMREYEMQLDKLYNARLAAKKARDDLYHPYGNRIPTKDGYVQQKMNSQYRPVKNRKTGPPKNANFHDMLRATGNSPLNGENNSS
eukprot:CAMPEP_0197005492 /NCGR_PEP_ID=MMETSP1380-20130617/29632_1 /TAXON_ID=5936 /ORGANISM="Euplotes crassus, Strain CT5" /LENGTH=344 /DNA_ID=CAMNT_0042424649 /DNA_START=145 /DNA_END=1179 /DNA_ORIENTATION=+